MWQVLFVLVSKYFCTSKASAIFADNQQMAFLSLALSTSRCLFSDFVRLVACSRDLEARRARQPQCLCCSVTTPTRPHSVRCLQISACIYICKPQGAYFSRVLCCVHQHPPPCLSLTLPLSTRCHTLPRPLLASSALNHPCPPTRPA